MGSFDRLDHQVLLQTLGEHIQDNRFLRLLSGALRAGYLEDWKFNATHSGVPQGGVVSPILSNIYLDKLDAFVEARLLPVYNRGTERRRLKAYTKHQSNYKKALREGEWEQARAYRKQMQSMPCRDPYDPDYRRLRYIRYADDFLLGFAGPHHEAEEIKRQIGEFLRDTLNLELSESKTLVTQATTSGNAAKDQGAARFLGYEIIILRNDHKHTKGKRSINGAVGLKVPASVIKEKCSRYTKHGRTVHRMEMVNDTVFSILTSYQLQYRGIANYYQLAYNLHKLSELKWVMDVSLTKTLARKLKISVEQVYRRYQTEVLTEYGMMKALQVTVQTTERENKGKKPLVATWGGIPLRRKRRGEEEHAILNDQDSLHPVGYARTEIVQRLLADTCELCGSQEDVEVHHIKAMKNLHKPGRGPKPKWVEVMAARRRKTLVVCLKCHNDIHAGRSLQRVRKPQDAQEQVRQTQETPTRSVSTGEPDTLKGVSPVRRGADGKVPV